MAIPLSMTTITVTRVEDSTIDGYDPNPPAPVTVAQGVRAVISPPSGSARLVGGDRIVYNATLQCDPCDLQAADTVTDTNGIAWTVLWVTRIQALGFDHLTAGVRIVQGAAP